MGNWRDACRYGRDEPKPQERAYVLAQRLSPDGVTAAGFPHPLPADFSRDGSTLKVMAASGFHESLIVRMQPSASVKAPAMVMKPQVPFYADYLSAQLTSCAGMT
jgi:hypothetical protein